MKLLTKEILKNFEKVGTKEDLGGDQLVLAKFFTPDSSWTWYALEYNPQNKIFFGLVDGLEVEFGDFSLDELEEARGPWGLPIERDRGFMPTPVKEILETIRKNRGG